jgi:hypothetical protein
MVLENKIPNNMQQESNGDMYDMYIGYALDLYVCIHKFVVTITHTYIGDSTFIVQAGLARVFLSHRGTEVERPNQSAIDISQPHPHGQSKQNYRLREGTSLHLHKVKASYQ